MNVLRIENKDEGIISIVDLYKRRIFYAGIDVEKEAGIIFDFWYTSWLKISPIPTLQVESGISYYDDAVSDTNIKEP